MDFGGRSCPSIDLLGALRIMQGSQCGGSSVTKMRAAGNEDGWVVAIPCTACAVWRYLGSLGKV